MLTNIKKLYVFGFNLYYVKYKSILHTPIVNATTTNLSKGYKQRIYSLLKKAE